MSATRQSSAPHAGSPRGQLWCALAIVAAVFFAYWPAWRAGFIWDDDLHVSANPHMLTVRGLVALWTTPAANYCPLTMTTFWALHALFGLAPLPFHVANVALHALSALLLWRVLARLRIPGAALGAGLWALHPVQVESAAWISELKNTQSAVFFLLSIWFYLRHLDRMESATRRRDYAWALGCGALAMLSKSSTVMLPAVLVLCSWWRGARITAQTLRALAPFFVLAAAASAWTIWEQKYSSLAQGADWDLTLAARLAGAGNVVWFYLGKLVWPATLSFIYPRWHVDPASLLAWLPALAAAGLAAAMFGWRRRAPFARALLFGGGCFGLLLFPVLGFFDVYFFRFSFVGDHLQYLASMAPLAGLGALAARAVPSRFAPGAMLPLVALAALTRHEVPNYQSNLTLFATTVAKNPGAWMAQSNLAAELTDAGRPDEAIPHGREALALRPNYAEAENNLGRALTRAGHAAEALAHLDRAVALAPDDLEARNNRAIALMTLDRKAEAIAAFEEVLRRNPAFESARLNLGLTLGLSGDFAAACQAFAQLLAQNPNHALAEMNLGLAQLAAGDRGGLSHLERAARLAPASANVQAGCGRGLVAVGRNAEAAEKFQRALQLNPRDHEARMMLVALLRELGRTEEAQRVAAQAK